MLKTCCVKSEGRRAASTALNLDEDGAIVRRQPKQTEVQHFKSAAFIEDSDDDEEADRIFFARRRRNVRQIDTLSGWLA